MITSKRLIIASLSIIIIFLAYLLIIIKKPIQIKSVYPAPNSRSNSLIRPITIKFKDRLSSNQQGKLRVEISPQTQFVIQWLDDKTLNFAPKTVFQEKTAYHISINYSGKLVYQWSFTSPAFDQLGLKERGKLEGFFDFAGKALEEAVQEKPWLLSLPIQEKNYSIDYFSDKQTFRVIMRINITSPFSREQQIFQIKNEVPKKLKEIGVDLTKEEIYYTFTP